MFCNVASVNFNIDMENMAMNIDINTKGMTIVMDIVSKINQYLVEVEHCCLGFLLKGLQTTFHSSIVHINVLQYLNLKIDRT